MDWGMKNRLSKIIRPQDGRCLMLAVDHGYFLGPTERLENAAKTIAPLLPYADSLMLTRGILRNCVPAERDIPIVLRVSGGTSIVGEDLSKETITTSIEEAIKLNVSCLALSIFVGSKYEHQTLASLGKLVDEGEKYGIPVLAVTAVGKEMGRDARYLGLACRVAAELGAHVVKTYYCDNFEKVVEACPVPLVVAGGKKLPEMDALKLAHDAVTHGASGVDMGRNIWQSDYPVAMVKAVKAIVHGKADVKEAYDVFLREREKAKTKEPQKIVKAISRSADFD
ncbi:3-hydroxy-5-phosphonooxypentane-2,4-dione thiolase [Nitrososphaera viennensis]|uniref:3-hydroxy-5-phosphonooxypentane-2,4-dione thiolase n=2 Tax=Nitrososphaera viennensis TaxID=1034015 RepID=A0A977IFW7_9ARCH|nr:3-hydroxy-5-phosphonooxypentane-2,4-dione thiolase [Nitrososphaera viennensis]AIC15074.1 putative aldolase LsrF [Nitrososphaera viennensis EN76]UVS70001.1 3-hydroxy-5-phosphonooxypentane-2,4-dione thiolase [Nitrososphaera viennensis]